MSYPTYPTYPTIYDVEPEPPAPPKKRRTAPIIGLVIAGFLASGAIGGVVGAHYSHNTTTTSLGSGAFPVSAPVSDPKSYTAIASKVLPSVVSIEVNAGG